MTTYGGDDILSQVRSDLEISSLAFTLWHDEISESHLGATCPSQAQFHRSYSMLNRDQNLHRIRPRQKLSIT